MTSRAPRIPLALKVGHTAFVAVLVPAYWRHYGSRNFLWFSDIALLGMVPALWREDRLVASALALSIALPEIPWNVGFFTRLLTGRELIGLSHYMFDRRINAGIRALSLFHVWLTPMILWTVYRLGYDRRAFAAQLLIGETALIAGYTLAPPEENINWVYGPGERPQSKLLKGVYFAAVMVLFPVCLWYPAHRLLKRWART